MPSRHFLERPPGRASLKWVRLIDRCFDLVGVRHGCPPSTKSIFRASHVVSRNSPDEHSGCTGFNHTRQLSLPNSLRPAEPLLAFPPDASGARLAMSIEKLREWGEAVRQRMHERLQEAEKAVEANRAIMQGPSGRSAVRKVEHRPHGEHEGSSALPETEV